MTEGVTITIMNDEGVTTAAIRETLSPHSSRGLRSLKLSANRTRAGQLSRATTAAAGGIRGRQPPEPFRRRVSRIAARPSSGWRRVSGIAALGSWPKQLPRATIPECSLPTGRGPGCDPERQVSGVGSRLPSFSPLPPAPSNRVVTRARAPGSVSGNATRGGH